jgi:flagellar basal body-associated protein FliL
MNEANVFLIIVIILLLIAAIVFLILWLAKAGTQKNQKNELSISGVKFNFTASSIIATWDSVGNASDIVTLYADTKPIILNAEGKPETTTIVSSGPVSGTSKTATINTGLTPNTKYYVDLVVTNPNFVGFNPNPDIVFTGESIPTTNFIIQEINTIGAITLNTTDQTKVFYQTGVNKTDISDIWTYDTTNFTISTRSLGASSTAPRPTLYNNNGVLAAKDATSATTDATSQWIYNVNGNNRWCIKGTITCMNLSSPIVNNSPITLVENSPTKFINIPTNL